MSDLQPLPRRAYRLLSDGQFHSGTRLAADCRVSRNAIWKAIAALRSLGVTVHAVPNRGYRLPAATALLERERIVKLLPRAVASRLRTGQCVWRTGSTNTDLLQRDAPPAGHFDFLTAEYQTAGRGRRARSWFAPPGGAICLSISWCFASLPRDISALSLAIGVCALRGMAQIGVTGAALKWPNDLVVGSAKLGGILIELRAEAGGPAYVVVGLGLNVALGAEVLRQVQASGTQAADLIGLGAKRPDRNRLAAALIASAVAGLEQFERDGFGVFASEWRAADALAGKSVVISSDSGSVTGHARGIDSGGALCLQTREGLQRFVTGEVSARAAP
ncbi:MAG: biotin--[acetyl-CoA-carboxylase] ligase [Steroidobacteraceae bacterium]|jgi:BirA family transcriptional regulator, biotin operon repressor / biotin---[acetyl-CoA-carboxylase] ligase